MNFAHMVGEHFIENQTESLLHTAVSWAPFVLGMMLAIIAIYYVTKKRQNPAVARIKIRRK